MSPELKDKVRTDLALRAGEKSGNKNRTITATPLPPPAVYCKCRKDVYRHQEEKNFKGTVGNMSTRGSAPRWGLLAVPHDGQ